MDWTETLASAGYIKLLEIRDKHIDWYNSNCNQLRNETSQRLGKVASQKNWMCLLCAPWLASVVPLLALVLRVYLQDLQDCCRKGQVENPEMKPLSLNMFPYNIAFLLSVNKR